MADSIPDSSKSKPNSRPFVSLILLALGASLGLNVAITWRALYWRHRLQDVLTERTSQRRPDPLALGASLPPLKGKHLNGSDGLVDYRTQKLPTIVYALQPSCGWCARNRSNLQALVNQSAGRYRVVCVSLSTDNLREYAANNDLLGPKVELLSSVSNQLLDQYRLASTPHTLVVSPEGRLLKSWSGAYQAKTQDEIEKFLSVHLPGLTAD